MNNYYNELSQLELLKQELDKFADSLENNKEGCFKHRIESFINILLNETQSQNYLRNKIQNYINEANYRGDVKSYVMQVFLSFFEPIEIKIPNSLIDAVKRNKEFDKAMIEGYNNFKSANNYTQSQEPHKEALSSQRSEKPEPELNKIWLSEPKISVDDLLTSGIEKGIWNDEYQIITAKGSLYGTGKTMLGSLFIALKGFAVSENIDYKEAGKVFCSFFNVPI